MPKLKLTATQAEELRAMLQDEGKGNKEVAKHFKDKYGIAVPAWKLSYVRAKRVPGRAWKVNTKTEGSEDPGQQIQEIVKLLSQIENGYKQVFKYLRGELIKSRQQVQSMVEAAGLKMEA